MFTLDSLSKVIIIPHDHQVIAFSYATGGLVTLLAALVLISITIIVVAALEKR